MTIVLFVVLMLAMQGLTSVVAYTSSGDMGGWVFSRLQRYGLSVEVSFAVVTTLGFVYGAGLAVAGYTVVVLMWTKYGY